MNSQPFNKCWAGNLHFDLRILLPLARKIKSNQSIILYLLVLTCNFVLFALDGTSSSPLLEQQADTELPPSPSMASINDLPAEILQKIFGYLPNPHDKRCPSARLLDIASVSKSWHTNAFEVFWSERRSCYPNYTREHAKENWNLKVMIRMMAAYYLITDRDVFELPRVRV